MCSSDLLYLNTAGGSHVYHILKESPNMFGGVSVGAYADEAKWVDANGDDTDDDDDEGYFQITKGGLREVSVVMYPNNPAAEVMKLEYFDEAGKMNPRHIEKALREAGLSRKDATTASSVLRKILEARDAPKIAEITPQPSESDAVEAAILEALELRELQKVLSNKVR